MSESIDSCRECGAALPDGARFCASCGVAVQSGTTERAEVPRHETSHSPVVTAYAAPRWFGLTPPSVLLVLAFGALVAGLMLLVGGRPVAGLLVLGLALLLAAAFLETARRKPDAAAVQRAAGAADIVRERTAFAAHAIRTRTAARREIVRRRSELLRLEGERDRLLRDLGAAVHGGGDGRDERDALGGLDARKAALEAEIASIAAAAGEEVGRAARAVQPTEVRPPDAR